MPCTAHKGSARLYGGLNSTDTYSFGKFYLFLLAMQHQVILFNCEQQQATVRSAIKVISYEVGGDRAVKE